MIRPFIIGFATTLQAHLQEADHRQLPGPEDSRVPEVARQAGADARRERAREVRRLRAVRGGLPGRRHLPRGGGERRQRAGRPALRRGLPDPQDALHLLRLLRRGLPGVGDLHGQGLRARGLQQQGLHLGQDRPAGAGAAARPAIATYQPASLSAFGALGDIHGAFDAARPIVARHPEVPFWLCVGDIADDDGALRVARRAGPLDPRQQRQLRRDRRRTICPRICTTFPTARSMSGRRGSCASPGSAARSRRRWYDTPAARAAATRSKGLQPRRSTARWPTSAATSCARRSRRARSCVTSTSS